MPAIAQTPMPTVVLITAAPTPAPTSSAMRLGDQGDDVRYVQQRLKDLGYLSGKVDGVYGSATETALKAFQAANGLSADGLVGKRTMDKLESSDAKAKPAENRSSATSVPRPVTYTPSEPTDYRYLQLGSTGRDVTKLQNRLIELGYFNQKATGSYEEETEVAVRAFQERNGQWVDGVAGQDTQSRLYSQKALPASKD
jgi:peptidoglycan hydrolase-like protein with peptidoglycan-binding domain